jgi:DNA-binding MarR family transcriptional regulator
LEERVPRNASVKQPGQGEQPVLDRIEQVLTDLARFVGTSGQAKASVTGNEKIGIVPPVLDADFVRLAAAHAWIRGRKARDKAFGTDLFSDPAWSMLLDLYVNGHAGRTVSVSSLSIGANVPLTTGTRWVALIERAGLIRREADRFDRRRTLVSLTQDGLEKVNDALDRAMESNRQLGIEHRARPN